LRLVCPLSLALYFDAPLPVPPWGITTFLGLVLLALVASLTAFLGLLLLALVASSARERRLTARRRAMRRLYRLCEGLASGRSSVEQPGLLRSLLPGLLGVTDVQVHLLDRASGTLRPPVDSEPAGFREKTVELCFRNRSLISVPDTHRSPFFDHDQATPRSMTCVPMFAEDDLLGVLEISDVRRVRRLSEDEQAAARHLGNQIAIGIKLIEQKSIREQALGGDRLETTYQLGAAVAEGMNEPLAAIAGALRALIARHPEDPDRAELVAILNQAGKVEGLLSHILPLIGLLREQVRLVDLSSLVQDLMARRQEVWNQRGIRVLDVLPPEPVLVPVGPGSVERILLSLFWYVEDRLAESSDKTIRLRVFQLAARAQVDIGWVGPALEAEGADPLDNPRSPTGDVFSLAVCRGLVRVNAGEIRLAMAPDGSWRFEVELPMAQPASSGAAGIPRASAPAVRPLTALVVEPDLSARQSLISLLSELGHRAVAAADVEDAMDLVKRLHFNIVFCPAYHQGSPWVDCFEGCRGRVDAFVLLTEGHDPALSAALPAGEAYTLAKPVSADELERLVQAVEARLAGLKQ
jgi:K+-sensing histidine kinase KdpD/CheY-like chemotaxis protein